VGRYEKRTASEVASASGARLTTRAPPKKRMRVCALSAHGPQLGGHRASRRAMALRAVALRLPSAAWPSTQLRLLRTAGAPPPQRDGEEAQREHAVVREVRRACAEHALLRPGDAVVACVSGGVDSVALLLALAHLAPELALQLHVLHFNHGLRVRAPRKASRKQPQTLLNPRSRAHCSAPCSLRCRAGGVGERGGAGARAG
jgi:hypothetical protein